MNKSTVLLFASAALLLAACGSGGSEAPVAVLVAEEVPDTASASPAGMAAWMTDLSVNPSDTKEPLVATRFAPPTPDDTEPETLK
jgi:uncharacterized lipoprotein YmbA